MCICVCVCNFSPFCSVFKVVAGTPLLTTPNSFTLQTFVRFLQGTKDCARSSFLAVFDGRHQASLDQVLKWIVSWGMNTGGLGEGKEMRFGALSMLIVSLSSCIT